MKIGAGTLTDILKKECNKRRRRTIAFILITLFILYRGVFSMILMSSNISITAHRGSTNFAPENTVASVLEAIALDVDYIEIDVQLSKDNQVFLLHDASFRRTARVKARAKDLTYEEISRLNVGAYKNKKNAFEMIEFSAPLLDEVIKVCLLSNVKLNIELKSYGDTARLPYEVVKIIQDNDFVDRCVVSSYSESMLRKVKELEPKLKVGLITKSNSISTYIKCGFVDFYSIYYVSLSPSIVMYIHAKHKEVYCWTPSNSVAIQTAIHAGVDNIITNNVNLTKFLIISNLK